MVHRSVLVFLCILEIFYVIPPLAKLSCYGRGSVRVFLDVVERLVAQLDDLATNGVLSCKEAQKAESVILYNVRLEKSRNLGVSYLEYDGFQDGVQRLDSIHQHRHRGDLAEAP
jgi:hypothetical protein